MCPYCCRPGRLMLLRRRGDRHYYHCRACGGDFSSLRANLDVSRRRLAAANRRLAATSIDAGARIVRLGTKGEWWSICGTLVELPYGLHQTGWLQHRIRRAQEAVS